MKVRIYVVCAALTAVVGVLLFGAAGRFDLPWFWAALALWSAYMAASSALTLRFNPELVPERMRPASERDPLTRKLAVLPGLGHFVVAGLDVGRYGWSSVPSWVQAIAFVVLAVGMVFIVWTFLTNRFASSAVRMQPERGHQVIQTGPYAVVRHPMYLGIVLITASSGLALGSWWSMLVALPIIPVFVRRTLLEERMLFAELAGYREYAQRTRWRVVPGVF